MIKRVFLFLLTNVLVMVTISLVLNLLGVRPYLEGKGINYESLLIFCAVWGMGGAFISLALSKTMAKWMMGVQIIDPNTRDPAAQQLVMTVHRLAQAAGLPKMPEVGYYQSPEVNAFATGPTKGNALVAVSSGLLERMGRAELEGVLGHEVAHIANGDMVTMTLIQGVVNAFTMFLARIFAFALSSAMRSDDEEGPSPMLNFVLVMVFDILFTLLGSIVVAYFSRLREFRADKGGATLAGREKMVAALQALRRTTPLVDTGHPALANLKIAGAPRSFAMLLMSHPPLEKRIEKLMESSATQARFA
jgi:heat shock protein HtpX